MDKPFTGKCLVLSKGTEGIVYMEGKMKEKIISKNFCFVFLAMLCSSMVMYMLMTTIAEYSSTFGASAAVAGIVSGIYVVGVLISRILAVVVLERVRWRTVSLIVAILHTIACAGYFLVHDIVGLILIRFLHGLCFGIQATTILTMGMAILPRSRYGEATGYLMLSTTVSIGIGPFTGGIVYDSFGPYGCFTMAISLSIIILLSMLMVNTAIEPAFLPESDREAKIMGKSKKLVEIKTVPISACVFLAAFGYVAVMSFYRTYAGIHHLEREFSYFFLIYSFTLLFTRPLAGKIQDKYGANSVCYTGIMSQTIGLFLIARYPCQITILICAIGCAFGYGTLNSCCNAIVCKQVPPERRSHAISTFWMFCDGGMGFGPIVLGSIAASFGYTSIYYLASAITLVGLPIYYFAWGKREHKRKQ